MMASGVVSATTAVDNKKLPSKESALFKQILRLYEFKQYKRGLKCADTILKKCPNHGETLAMKGLFLNHIDPVNNNTAAYDLVKQGLRYDLFSPICWHVYGLLYRSDKNYEEAMKCYRHALKYDKENIQVLRDFSLLQIQMRDYEGFNKTKHELLRLRPNQRIYWIGLAVSYHCLKDFPNALKVLDVYETTCQDQKEGVLDFEHSELMMYRNMVLEESGDYDAALQHLLKVQKRVCDTFAWNEKHAEMLLKVGRKQDAEVAYRGLIKLNQENILYIRGLLKSMDLPSEPEESIDSQKRQDVLKTFSQLQEEYPRSHLLKREALKFAQGNEFRDLLDSYLKPMFRKGVPSLFVNLKPLYESPDKVIIIQNLVEGYSASLATNGKFSPTEADKESPSVYMWVLYFLAQHYDRQLDTERALKSIEAALQHTPTLLELVMFKGRIYKHGGSAAYAAFIMNDARELDLQDRFINTKSTKYFVRNDEVGRAEQTIALFARQGDFEEKMQDLVEMQCIWFALEVGRSYTRQRQYGKALKRFHQILKHFNDFTDDQFDFHSYSVRKMTLRSYVGLLRFEDELKSRDEFVTAVEAAVRIYLKLSDDPSIAIAELNEIQVTKLKLDQPWSKKSSQKDTATSSADAAKKSKDDDQFGEKYLECKDPLEEAMKWVKQLQINAPNVLITHRLAFEVYIRQKKFLLAFKALKQVRNIDPDSPFVHEISIRFWKEYLIIPIDSPEINPISREVIEEDMLNIYPGLKREDPLSSLLAFNQEFIQEKAIKTGDIPALLTGCAMSKLLSSSTKPDLDLIKTLAETCTAPQYKIQRPILLTDEGMKQANLKFTLQNAVKIYEYLSSSCKNLESIHDIVEQFSKECRRQFPLATIFMSESEREELRLSMQPEKDVAEADILAGLN